MSNNHPLRLFKYCPLCGSSLFIINDFKSKKCTDCSFVYYFNPGAATVAFIFDDAGKLLVARRAKEPAKGTFDLPGGFVDLNETGEEAIRREVEEETHLKIDNFEFVFSLPNIYPYSGFEVHTVDMFFEARIADGSKIVASDDVAELFWIGSDDLKPELFGLNSIRKGVEKMISKLKK